MSRRSLGLLALLPLGFFLAVAAFLLRERILAGRDMPGFSSWSDNRDGLAEAAHFVGELGCKPVPLSQTVNRSTDHGLLIIAEPEFSGPSDETGGITEYESRGILDWVAAGNTLLFCSRHETALHEALHVSLISGGREDGGNAVIVEPDEAGVYSADVERMAVRDGASLQSPEGLKLWSIRDREGALLLRHGAGRILVVADPTLLTRRGLLGEDNAVFFANIARSAAKNGTVYFDEYHHGFRSAGGVWGYLGHYGQQLVFLPLLLAVGAAVRAAGVRLGPAVPRPVASGADAVDYASALALLYRRAGVRRLPARTLSRGFLESLTRHLRLRRNALPAEILASWIKRAPGRSAERLQYLLRGVGELRKGDVAPRRLVMWSKAFDEFQVNWLKGDR